MIKKNLLKAEVWEIPVQIKAILAGNGLKSVIISSGN
jgi:hypothetical protein